MMKGIHLTYLLALKNARNAKMLRLKHKFVQDQSTGHPNTVTSYFQKMSDSRMQTVKDCIRG